MKVVAGGEDTFTLLYNPYQQAFLRALDLKTPAGKRAFTRFILLAGRRGGKTLIGAVAACKQAAIPKTLGWCVAPTYGDLHDYVIPAVLKVMPHNWIAKNGWSAQHTTLKLVNGSAIAFRSAEDPERMRGPGVHWSWWDEIRKINKLSWETFRPALSDYGGPAWFTTTPNGFDWGYHAFYKRSQPGASQVPGYWGCTYTTADNPFIPREEIEEARATLDPKWFEQEYEAKIVRFEGAIYDPDRVERCILRTDEEVRRYIPTWPHIPQMDKVLVGMDPGADHPFAAVFLYPCSAGLVVINEYTRRMTSYADHADSLKLLLAGHQNTQWAVDRTATQAMIELSQYGIQASAAENSVLLGIQRVQAWMRTKKLFFIEHRCPQLIDQLTTYHWKDTTSNQGEKRREDVFKIDDDLADALRYGVMLWPELPAPPVVSNERTLESVPEQSRKAWLRERAANNPKNEDEVDWNSGLTPLQDFWGGDNAVER
jgi:hypothetical protein